MKPPGSLKRARTSAVTRCSGPSYPSSPSSRSPLSQVKGERNASPLAQVEKRLITSGTRRFAPVPDDCLQSCTDYKQNRSKWVARCVEELRALNLIPERKLLRDDGLIIDWRSHVPVLSDTLRPDPQDLAATIMLTHRSNAQRRTELPTESTATLDPLPDQDTSDMEPPPKKRAPPPPRPGRNNTTLVNESSGDSRPWCLCPERPLLPDGSDRIYQVTYFFLPSRNRNSNLVNRPSTPLDVAQDDQVNGNLVERDHEQSTTPCTSSTGEEEMLNMTLSYLRRYVQTYESDRASLASAYARHASFSYRVHQVVQNISPDPPPTWTASPRSFSSGAKRARLDITTTLLTLPCLHSDAQHVNATQLEYDIFHLGMALGVFVVCRAVISNKTVVHNLILQRKEVDVDDAASEGVWPLSATAHQIVVFQT